MPDHHLGTSAISDLKNNMSIAGVAISESIVHTSLEHTMYHRKSMARQSLHTRAGMRGRLIRWNGNKVYYILMRSNFAPCLSLGVYLSRRMCVYRIS